MVVVPIPDTEPINVRSPHLTQLVRTVTSPEALVRYFIAKVTYSACAYPILRYRNLAGPCSKEGTVTYKIVSVLNGVKT
jgi:hypothetical protein